MNAAFDVETGLSFSFSFFFFLKSFKSTHFLAGGLQTLHSKS